MTPFGLLIGAAIPAVCLGLGTVFMRASLGAGASIPLYLAVVGSVVALYRKHLGQACGPPPDRCSIALRRSGNAPRSNR